ncbi:helix-turn-helix domain-containing protein [Xanthomonas campestris]|uniref:helix-turn-helix domain-containing protein n=1 Tax=Xanthomonas campestris TaxID=339 RepID=UPI001F3F60B9|nr:helix-turn-helix domain-containing protein [Xanthomonas campestris]MDM7674547.1 helix-turn-helix domain-containing protein [Xanthomonas campestris pv. campestris]
MDMTWSDRIKGLEESGKSLTEIGRLIGKSPQAVSDIKQGRTREPGGMAAVRLHHLHQSIVGTAVQSSAGSSVSKGQGTVAITKRALRAKLGLANDAGLAVLLKLPRDQIEAWGEDDQLPALPSVLALVAPQPKVAPNVLPDLDAERIVPVEVA